jgi:hypothetical protein
MRENAGAHARKHQGNRDEWGSGVESRDAELLRGRKKRSAAKSLLQSATEIKKT